MTYDWHTYWDGMAGGTEEITPPANGHFYDELPWLVRTIDFSKKDPFEIQLSGTTINSKKDSFAVKRLKVNAAGISAHIDQAALLAAHHGKTIAAEGERGCNGSTHRASTVLRHSAHGVRKTMPAVARVSAATTWSWSASPRSALMGRLSTCALAQSLCGLHSGQHKSA